MRERVLITKGKRKVILVAPHGAEDKNTGVLVEKAAKSLNCHAVINYGFTKSDYVDVENDLADCSSINHIKQPVIYDEFLKPIIKIKDKIHQSAILKNDWKESEVLVFYINSCEEIPSIPFITMIVGYGIGTNKDSITCNSQKRNMFIAKSRKIFGDFGLGEIYEGKNRFSGRNTNHINQYFVKHQNDISVDSLLITFPIDVINSENKSIAIGILLAHAIEETIKNDDIHYNSIDHFFL